MQQQKKRKKNETEKKKKGLPGFTQIQRKNTLKYPPVTASMLSIREPDSLEDGGGSSTRMRWGGFEVLSLIMSLINRFTTITYINNKVGYYDHTNPRFSNIANNIQSKIKVFSIQVSKYDLRGICKFTVQKAKKEGDVFLLLR